MSVLGVSIVGALSDSRLAARTDQFARTRQKLIRDSEAALSAQNFRVYTNPDVVGTELGGASKNVMALAAGMVAGLGLGANTVSALVTRGLAEMTRLALAEGGRLETLMGLAGLGDLVLTCTGGLSRNRSLGMALARGRTQAAVEGESRMIAEGARTVTSALALAGRHGVSLPICAAR